jgi:CBS domain-containing protein
MKAADVMSRGVITVTPDTPVPEIAKLLVERRISAVPVADAAGRLVGLVSEADLLRRREIGTEKQRTRLAAFFTPDYNIEQDYIRAHALKAADVMEADLVTVDPEVSLVAIVDLFEKHGINRVPVVEDDKLVGIVSRADLVRALATWVAPEAAPDASDRHIRRQLLDELAQQRWGRHDGNNIVVKHGIVHFWGLVDSPTEFAALRVAAETIPGVRGVEDHTIVASDTFYPGP